MSSCQDALINNIYTNLQNFESTIVFSLEKRRLKKIWQAAASRRASDVAASDAFIDAKYDSGFYIKKTYPGIPQAAINSVLTTYRVPDLNTFYSKLIVYNGRVEGCRSGFPTCLNANEVEKLCCNCFHAQLGKEEGCNTAGAGCQGGPTDCNARSTSNLFQSFIDSEKTEANATIDRNIQNLYNNYNSYIQRNLLVPNDVGCCQSTQFRGISASNITFDNISNQCTIKK